MPAATLNDDLRIGSHVLQAATSRDTWTTSVSGGRAPGPGLKGTSMRPRIFSAIALLSISLIAIELVWTRLFSAEYFYTFAFLVLSLAILGLGMGALALRLFSFLDRDRNLPWMFGLTGFIAMVGPYTVLKLQLKFSAIMTSPGMLAKFIAAVILLSAPFFFGGIALAILFKRYHYEMPKLYMADLIGAGLGIAAAVGMMNLFQTPPASFLIAVPVLIGMMILARRWLKIIPIVLIILAVVGGHFSKSILVSNRENHGPVMSEHWDAMALVKILDFGEELRRINVDNIANSPVYAFDGNWNRPDSELYQFGLPCDYLIDQFDSCTFLSLGAGGGVDVMQALQEGATEVHAVEVNPFINYLMTRGELAEFSGHIYDDPRVKVMTEDARAYVRRHVNTFDVIYSLSSNTFSALASGSFALAENYLFTTEAFEDYWLALTDSGFLLMEHQFYMPRMVSEVMDALTNLGVENVTDHFAVYALPAMRRQVVLMSKRPLTDEIRNHGIVTLSPELDEYIHLLYPPPDTLQDNLINRIVMNGWRAEADSAVIDLSPCTDNRPFTAQMGLWRNYSWDAVKERVLPYEFYGFPISQVIIVVILAVVIVLFIPLSLLPYFKKGEKLRLVPWLYFFVIGMAFMAVEVVLIQKYTFFVGPSAYSIATILLTLLVASGIGSRFARRIGTTVAFVGILIWLALDMTLFREIIYGLSDLTMIPRILVSAVLVFPLGFFMGMPFPKGTLRVGSLIDWGFAVNGAASVIGSTAIILIAVSYGFTVALAIAGGLYALAYILISFKSAW
jgi:spermidine synthase